jgi:hypothetical protein
MKFASYMAFSFITFFHILLGPFLLSLYIRLYVLCASVLFSKLCIFIVMFVCDARKLEGRNWRNAARNRDRWR